MVSLLGSINRLPSLRFIAIVLVLCESVESGKSRLRQRLPLKNVQQISAINGTLMTLECVTARDFIRRHMAPDFENPQLVRRLDWIHEESLVASYQQDMIFDADATQQWWVSGIRYQLNRPFFELQITPVLSQDSGHFRCHFETDALFEPSESSWTISLNVLTKPQSPSKPAISQFNDSKVILQWTHATRAADSPILRYSIRIQNENAQRIVATENNETNVRIDGLRPNTRYSFSVRAENFVGKSAFGSPNHFNTIGLPPKKAPKIVSIRNASEDGCINVEWSTNTDEPNDQLKETEEQPINGFRITVSEKSDARDAREWSVKGGKVRRQLLCHFDYLTQFVLSLASTNVFGSSPETFVRFKTDEGVPADSPIDLHIRSIPGATGTIEISWKMPKTPNGVIVSYQLYCSEHTLSNNQTPALIHSIPISTDDQLVKKAYAHNITKLVPGRRYFLQVSASTSKGEGPRSDPIVGLLEIASPLSPRITSILYSCESALMEVQWKVDTPRSDEYFFKVRVESKPESSALIYNTTKSRLVIEHLRPDRRYSIQVLALVQSVIDSKTFVESLASMPEFILIPKASSKGHACVYQSSLCFPTLKISPVKCEPFESVDFKSDEQAPWSSISMRSSPTDANASFIYLFTSISLIMVIFVLFVWLLKRKCIFVKSFLKLQTERTASGLEIASLIKEAYDSDFGHTIAVENFDEYYEKMSANNNEGFQKQFADLELKSPTCSELSFVNANGPHSVESANVMNEEGFDEGNRLKNRYLNVSANMHSRIRVCETAGDGYINANYIDSCDEKNAYIATQAPLPSTFEDFWQMVWQERSCIIVIITNLIESGRDQNEASTTNPPLLVNTPVGWRQNRKCDQYWPEVPKSRLIVGRFQLTLEKEISTAVFVHRVIKIQPNVNNSAKPKDLQSSERCVHHLHFTCWPDHGVPKSPFPLLYFMNYVANVHSKYNRGPCVIHCRFYPETLRSAGVGRSGSFVLIDSMRRHLLRCDRINVQAHLRHMRRQRSKLIQTLEQYVFCHTVLRHLITNGITLQPISNFPNYFNFLFNQRHNGQKQKDATDSISPQTRQQRIQAQYKLLCACTHQPQCRRPLPAKGYVVLPGFHIPEEHIVCNWSLDNSNLWELIWERRCQTVLLLLDDESTDDPDPTIPLLLSSVDQMEVNGSLSKGQKITAKRRITDESSNCRPNEGRFVKRVHLTDSTMTNSVTSISSRDEGKLALIAYNSNANVLLRNNGEELNVRIVRIQCRALENETWLEIERVQKETLGRHRSLTMVLDRRKAECSRNDAALPFTLCLLQSVACQMEQEHSVDVVLFLSTFHELACGCWTSQANVEFIYRRVLELVHLQKSV